MPITRSELESALSKKFADDEILITDLAGDDDHWQVKITSKQFNNLTRIEQHKLVYEALGKKVGNQIHALALKTKKKI